MKHVSVARWFVIVTLTLLCVSSFLAGIGLIFSSSGAASSHDVEAQGARRDCVTTISAARNSVFTAVQIDTAQAQNIVNLAVLSNQTGTPVEVLDPAGKSRGDLLKDYSTIALRLIPETAEATRLQPAKVLDALIAKGGVVDGVKYDPCPS